MSNQLSMLPLYLACQSLVSQNFSNNNLNVVIQTPPEPPKLAQDLPRGYTVFPDIGVAYKVYRTPMSWGNAHKYCVGEGGNLALIDSFEKVNYILELLGLKKEALSVGIHRLFDGNEWIETKTGLPPAMIPWSDESYLNDKSRKCTRLWENRIGLYASACDSNYSFVCEISI